MRAEPSELLVRGVALYLPILLVIALAVQVRPDGRRMAGALLATCWNVPALLVLNLVAVRAGWWSFSAEAATVAGIPADLWVGWVLLWGAVPLLAGTRILVPAVVLVAADLVLMPLGAPVVDLDRTWLIGEGVGVATCLVPGLLLGRWTAEDEHLAGRALLQITAFSGLVFFVVPSLVFTIAGEGWGPLLARPRWHFVFAGLILAPFAAMALQAVREFTASGGTPVPLDPPRALVTTGPYAYVANPMQLATTILLVGWAVLLSSPAVAAMAAMAAVFSAGLAAAHEDRELVDRFGDEWRSYRARVRLWLPRWRPAIAGDSVVYIAGSCEPCSEVGRFLTGRRPVALDVRPAEQCPFPLERITYVRGAARASGLAAFGRSLEHVNLAWATVSWIGRIPLVEQVFQLIADAVGFGPRAVPQSAAEASPGAEVP